MSRDIELADEFVAELNHASRPWNGAFTATREYVPDWDVRKDLATLQCCVIPEGRTASGFERDQLQKEFSVVLCFAQRLTAKTKAEVDALMDMVESVVDFFELGAFEIGAAKYVNNGWEDRARFDADQLDREKRGDVIAYTGTFLAVTAFTFVLQD